MNGLGRLKFLASGAPPRIFGPSLGGVDSRSTLIGNYDLRDVEIADARHPLHRDAPVRTL